MVTVIGRTLPLAAAIAVSPIPVIVTVLLLVSGDARPKSVGYLLGRICAFAAVVAVMAVVIGATSPHHSADRHPTTAASIVRICAGVVLVVIAIRLWLGRGKQQGETRSRRLFQRVEQVTPAGAFGLGVALVVVDVSSLIPGVMGGLAIGEAKLPAAPAIGAGAVFVLIALASCIAPVVAYLIAGQRLDPHLAAAKTWLVANDRTVLMVLLFVLGPLLIGRGIEALSTG